jgi:hypothetical protein
VISSGLNNAILIDFITFATMTTDQIKDLRDRIEALRRHL